MKNATRTGGAIGVKKIVGAKRIRHCCDPQRPAMDHWRRLVIEGLQDLLTIAARSGPPFSMKGHVLTDGHRERMRHIEEKAILIEGYPVLLASYYQAIFRR